MHRLTPTLTLVFTAAALLGCDTAVEPDTSELMAPTGLEARTVDVPMGPPPEVQRAEFRNGFCFFIVIDGGFNGYSGASTTVMTPSGQTAYRCKADLLFGPGISKVLNIRDVPFRGDFTGPQPSCHIRATPGPNGQAAVNCHSAEE